MASLALAGPSRSPVWRARPAKGGLCCLANGAASQSEASAVSNAHPEHWNKKRCQAYRGHVKPTIAVGLRPTALGPLKERPFGQPTSEAAALRHCAIYLISVVILILGLCYASVPFYQLYCQTGRWAEPSPTGFGGNVQKNLPNATRPQADAGMQSEMGHFGATRKHQRGITIHFNADVCPSGNLTFKPTLQKIKVYPGDTALTFYMAQNQTDEPLAGISTYHVSPSKAGVYFNKIQCFCFEEQRLKPHESIEMPILFFIDPDFEKDPKMKDVETITLSYTFYRSTT